jgi:uncharacterized protein YndB with AHSA1/START domain
VRRTFPFPRDRVFAAWTEPDAIAEWFGEAETEMLSAAVDLRVGGAYRLDMRNGEQTGAVEGTYLEVDPPERLVYSWRWDLPGRGPGHESQVTVDFRDLGGTTEIVVTHEGLPSDESAAFHRHGWMTSLERFGQGEWSAAAEPRW